MSAETTTRCPPQQKNAGPKKPTTTAAASGHPGMSHSSTVWRVSDTGRRLQRLLLRERRGRRDLSGRREPRKVLRRRGGLFLGDFGDRGRFGLAQIVPGIQVESPSHSVKS